MKGKLMIDTEIITLLSRLVALPSVTPNDAGCQDLLIHELTTLGFQIERFHANGADSFWATHGQGHPVMVFAGHTDVVPVGDANAWHTPPFVLTQQGDWLIGRGVADMKGSLVCMIAAIKQYLSKNPQHPGTLALLITSAEEGPSMHGTPIVLDALQQRGQKLDYVLVGEPTSLKQTGDQLKHGRRGSLTGALTIHGKQGHIAYPHLADNPIHKALPALQALTQIHLDDGSADFDASCLQISNIHAGTGAGNVIPGECQVDFNIRYSPQSSASHLEARVKAALDIAGLDYTLTWTHYGKPYLTASTHPLIDIVQQAVQHITGLSPALSTTGGTSDARYFADMTSGIIELGPAGSTMHQANECVNINDLRQFYEILCYLLPLLLKTPVRGCRQ